MFVLGGATMGSNGTSNGRSMLSQAELPGFGQVDPEQAHTRNI